MPSLEDLVLEAQSGNHEAYETIVNRFREMAVSYAFSILGDHDLAEDASQEAFLSVYCDLLALREPKAFPGWLKRTVRNHAISLVRGRQRILLPLDQGPEVVSRESNARDKAQSNENTITIHKAVDALPTDEAEVIRLFYLEELSLLETAQRLGITSKAVKSRLHRARTRLRTRLLEKVTHDKRMQTSTDHQSFWNAATQEALNDFDNEIGRLTHVPTDEEQLRLGELLCAKGRIHRFRGEMNQALDTFSDGLNTKQLKKNAQWRMRFRTEIGLTYVQTSDYAKARREFQAARLAVRRNNDESNLLCVILNGLSICCWGEGEFAKARRFCLQTIEESRRVQCAELEAESCNNLAMLYWKNGKLEEALLELKASMKLWRRIKNRFGQTATLMNIGIIEENLGKLTIAKRHYVESMQLAKQIDYQQIQGACHANLANIALFQKCWSEALEHCESALEVARHIADRRSEAIALENQAYAFLGQKQFQNARHAMTESKSIARKIKDQERLFSLRLFEIELLLAEGKNQGLEKRFASLENTLKIKGYRSERPRLLRIRALVEKKQGNDLQARRLLKQALLECRKQKNRIEERNIEGIEKLWKR